MEIRDRVNFDFEKALSLKNVNYRGSKSLNIFEYIYFLLNINSSNTLVTETDYNLDYLEYLKDKGFIIPCFSKDITLPSLNWWADLSNLENEIKLNSKITTNEWTRKNGYSFHNCLTLNDDNDLHEYLNKNLTEKKFYYRSEFGFSGMGNKVIYSDKKYKLSYPGVICPFLTPSLSFGITVNFKTNDFFIIKNILDSRGAFCGGKLIEVDDLARELKLNKKVVLLELLNLFDNLQKYVDKKNIQFDSMIYEKDNKKHWYKIVEINSRKTMGTVIKKLTDSFGQGTWFIKKNSYNYFDNNRLEAHLRNLYDANIIVTSPIESKLISYYQY